MRPTPRRTLVLDLDGTLVDTLPDLRASLNRLMAAHRLEEFPASEVAGFIGDGAGVLVRRAMAARQREPEQADLDAFLADYSAHTADESVLFPGVADTLERARSDGWHLAVCTNKPEAPARSLLGALGIASLFAAIGGGDSFPSRKPDPAHLLATIAAAAGEPGASVMVGDHRNDILAATGAAIPAIFASWGYGSPDMAAAAAAQAAKFSEVLALADKLLSS
ncbi:MAG: HAD hydrolase-like protein [Janthinobacterium lividum]